eukprot:4090444-Prymnesium_polylepis.1
MPIEGRPPAGAAVAAGRAATRGTARWAAAARSAARTKEEGTWRWDLPPVCAAEVASTVASRPNARSARRSPAWELCLPKREKSAWCNPKVAESLVDRIDHTDCSTRTAGSMSGARSSAPPPCSPRT